MHGILDVPRCHRCAVAVLGLGLLSLLLAQRAGAQADWPERPVRIVTSTAPAGAADTLARNLATRLSAQWKQPVVVENRPGAGGVIATSIVARATRDGYSFGLLGSTLALNPATRNDLPYDTLRDLQAIARVASSPAVLVTSSTFPASTPAEFFALIRANPGKYTYASPGVGTNGHRAMESLRIAQGLDIVHVPYKGGAPATTALLSNEVSALMASPAGFQQHINSGRLKVIGVTSVQRFPTNPNAPTFAESGVPGFNEVEWWILITPSGVPAARVDRVYRDVAIAVKDPEFARVMNELGIELSAAPPSESARFLASEIKRIQKLSSTVRITP